MSTPWAFGGLRLISSEAMDIPEESRPDNQADWHDHYGDRKQMLVFIGQDMDEAAIRGMLDDCLPSNWKFFTWRWPWMRTRQNTLTDLGIGVGEFASSL